MPMWEQITPMVGHGSCGRLPVTDLGLTPAFKLTLGIMWRDPGSFCDDDSFGKLTYMGKPCDLEAYPNQSKCPVPTPITSKLPRPVPPSCLAGLSAEGSGEESLKSRARPRLSPAKVPTSSSSNSQAEPAARRQEELEKMINRGLETKLA